MGEIRRKEESRGGVEGKGGEAGEGGSGGTEVAGVGKVFAGFALS